ncbi:MAG: hypothetical protein P4N59_03190 [Negativicutes bacterium]|nr:hypothetical protein [Negativicutes bacterium]
MEIGSSSSHAPMKTVVYQSYRTENVPGWISRCLDTVRAWAKESQYDYEFYDDSFFDCLPQWYKDKTEGNMCLMSDLARLYTAKRLLAQGYERAIWVDADMIVFDSANFVIPVQSGFAFCREAWVEKEWGRYSMSERVNNAVSVFTAGSEDFLEFYISACITIVRESQGMPQKIAVGTIFLTNLHSQIKFPLLNNVGLFSPAIMQAILTDSARGLREYARGFGYPVAAANLCSSFRGPMEDEMFETVIEKLIESKGGIVNRYSQEGKSLGPFSRLFK